MSKKNSTPMKLSTRCVEVGDAAIFLVAAFFEHVCDARADVRRVVFELSSKHV